MPRHIYASVLFGMRPSFEVVICLVAFFSETVLALYITIP